MKSLSNAAREAEMAAAAGKISDGARAILEGSARRTQVHFASQLAQNTIYKTGWFARMYGSTWEAFAKMAEKSGAARARIYASISHYSQASWETVSAYLSYLSFSTMIANMKSSFTTKGMNLNMGMKWRVFPTAETFHAGLERAGVSLFQVVESLSEAAGKGFLSGIRKEILTFMDPAIPNPDRDRIAQEIKKGVQFVSATAGEHAGANAGAHAGKNFAVSMMNQAGSAAKKAGSAVMSFVKPLLFISIPLIIIALVYAALTGNKA